MMEYDLYHDPIDTEYEFHYEIAIKWTDEDFIPPKDHYHKANGDDSDGHSDSNHHD